METTLKKNKAGAWKYHIEENPTGIHDGLTATIEGFLLFLHRHFTQQEKTKKEKYVISDSAKHGDRI